MATRFSELEARLNSAVFSRLSNVEATLAGVTVHGIFDKAYQLGDAGGNGFATTQPMFTLPSSSVPASVTGLLLVIGGLSYTVVLSEPDGTGVTQLLLEKA